MESVDGRPPRSAQQPCRPGTDLKGEITGEGRRTPPTPSTSPAGTKVQPHRRVSSTGDWPVGRALAGRADEHSHPTGSRPEQQPGPRATLEIPGRVHFLDFSFQSQENGVNHRHLFNSDLIQSSDDSDKTHLRRTGLLLGFEGFPAARQVTPWS